MRTLRVFFFLPSALSALSWANVLCYDKCLHTRSKTWKKTLWAKCKDKLQYWNIAPGTRWNCEVGFSSQQRIHGFTAHCDHRNRNVSQCPCFPCTYLTFSFMRCWRADPHGQQTRAHNIATHGLSLSSWLVAPVNVTSSYCTRQPANAMVRKGLWAHIIHIQPIAPLTYMHKHIGTDVWSCFVVVNILPYVSQFPYFIPQVMWLYQDVFIKTSFTSIHAKLIQPCIIMLSITLVPVLSDLLRLRAVERWAACQKLTEQREKPE